MDREKIVEPEVFISYSHDNEEIKSWVLQLATRLRNNGVNAILDVWHLRLGTDLSSFMERGLSRSHRVICVCSEGYVKKANEGKGGAGYEKQIMTAELIQDQNTNWVIPLIRNNSGGKKTPTFLAGRIYISFEDDRLYEANYEKLLRDILDEPVLPIPPIGRNPFQNIREFAKQSYFPASERYHSPSTKGIVTFDYSNNNGSYTIGQGNLMFQCRFSKGSDVGINIYSQQSGIRTVALVKDKSNIFDINDARIYDTSSHSRKVKLNQIAIYQNNNGFYTAIKILSIKDDRFYSGDDEVSFEYFIQTNGSPNFSS